MTALLAAVVPLASCTAPPEPGSPMAPAALASQAEPAVRTADALPPKAAFEEMLAAFDVPGMAMATLTNCVVDGVVAAGTADIDGGVPVEADTAFEAASLTKPLFAAIVLELADEGVIDLDRPLVPFAYPRIRDEAAFARITPRLVLTHRTGMPNWSGDSQAEDRDDPIRFATAPGEAYSYSGEAFELLRAYVESETGRSFATLFEERFGDLMPNSAVNGVLRGDARPSRGYASASDPRTGRDLYLTPHETGAAWGLITTAGDYAAFVGYVCKGAGLSPALSADMLRPQAPVPQDGWPGPVSYGLGWLIMTMGTETIAMHSGNNDEYRSLAAFLPETGEGYVILTNGRNGEAMISAIMNEAEAAE